MTEKTTCATSAAVRTAPISGAPPPSRMTCHGKATQNSVSPAFETTCPAKNRRKIG